MTYMKALFLITITIVALCVILFLIMLIYEAWKDSELRKDMMARKKRRDK